MKNKTIVLKVLSSLQNIKKFLTVIFSLLHYIRLHAYESVLETNRGHKRKLIAFVYRFT